MGMPATQKALRKIVRENPCSLRRLADYAGLDQSNLLKAAEGKRSLTPSAARKLAKALGRWSETFGRLAEELETAIAKGGNDG